MLTRVDFAYHWHMGATIFEEPLPSSAEIRGRDQVLMPIVVTMLADQYFLMTLKLWVAIALPTRAPLIQPSPG